ncbi:hypothetical protein X743_01775 [Mesorhizobium sp. LNHC252B00]|nr:hypothetical protein X743_01775 [Mesorhizobium sp. LNHC252B00]
MDIACFLVPPPLAIKPGQCRRLRTTIGPTLARDVAAAVGLNEKGRYHRPFSSFTQKYRVPDYCAGAGAGFAGAGSAGFSGVMLFVVELSVAGGVAAGGVAGFIGCSAGGGVLWVVVLSVPLSLQAATPSKAKAETDARMSFFILSLLRYTLTLP